MSIRTIIIPGSAAEREHGPSDGNGAAVSALNVKYVNVNYFYDYVRLATRRSALVPLSPATHTLFIRRKELLHFMALGISKGRYILRTLIANKDRERERERGECNSMERDGNGIGTRRRLKRKLERKRVKISKVKQHCIMNYR